jgi:hypothetical protein
VGFECGVFLGITFAENWHVALGRRPLAKGLESSIGYTLEARLF